MSEQLTKQIESMEQKFESLKDYFAAAGQVSPDELEVLKDVKTKLLALRQRAESRTAARPEASPASVASSSAASASSTHAAAAGATKAGAKPKSGGGKGEMELGGAVIEKLSLGPPVVGPRIHELWALLAADGSGALDRSNSKFGAQLNESGRAVLKGFLALKETQLAWLSLYGECDKLATRSGEELKKLEQTAGAIGKRSKDRAGSYVRGQSEAYLKAQRNFEDKLRAIGPLEEGLRKAISQLNEAGLNKDKKTAERTVESSKEAYDAEKKRVDELKSQLNGLLGLAIKVVKQDWTSIAEDAVKFVGSQLIDAIPTARLDELKQQLEKATADLKRIEDLVLLAALETASAGLRGAVKALDDGRHDVVDALADLDLAQKTAVEALGESHSTANAAKMIAMRAQMLALIERTKKAVARYQREAPPYAAELDRVAGLYRSMPSVMKMSKDIDLASEYARTLSATAQENAEALTVWKGYVVDIQNSCVSAMGRLNDGGDGGFMVHLNRVTEVLQTAIANR